MKQTRTKTLITALTAAVILFGALAELAHAQFSERHPEFNYKIYIRDWCDGECFVIEGSIGHGLPTAFKKEIKRRPDIKKVWFLAGGGYVKQSEYLYRMIKKRGIHTYAQTCGGICSDIFIAGKTRTLVRGGMGLGFGRISSFFDSVGNARMRTAENKIKRRYKKQGVSKEFLGLMFKDRDRNTTWFPTHEELLSHGIVHRIINE